VCVCVCVCVCVEKKPHLIGTFAVLSRTRSLALSLSRARTRALFFSLFLCIGYSLFWPIDKKPHLAGFCFGGRWGKRLHHWGLGPFEKATNSNAHLLLYLSFGRTASQRQREPSSVTARIVLESWDTAVWRTIEVH